VEKSLIAVLFYRRDKPLTIMSDLLRGEA